MPITIAHPAAILPFRKLCPGYFNFAALVCGSMAPDLLYPLQLFQISALGHTFGGSFTIDVATSFILLAIFRCTKNTIASQLPSPHRQFWWHINDGTIQEMFAPRAMLVIIWSLLVGSWTHIVWDAFTHSGGFAVEAFPLLRMHVFSLGSSHFEVYKLLQYGFSLLGILVLGWYYTMRLNQFVMAGPGEAPASEATSKPSNDVAKVEYIKLFRLLVLSCALALVLALAQGLFFGQLKVTMLFHNFFIFIVDCFVAVPTVLFAAGYLESRRKK